MAVKSGLKKAENADCGCCDKIKLYPENLTAMAIIKKAMPGAFDGFGGIRLDNIRIVIDEMGFDGYERSALFEKSLAFFALMREVSGNG